MNNESFTCVLQVKLPPERYVLYHQGHGREERVERSREAWEEGGWASPVRDLISDCRIMLGFGAPIVLNDASWGLAGHQAVTETSFGHVYGHVASNVQGGGGGRGVGGGGFLIEGLSLAPGEDLGAAAGVVISEKIDVMRSRCEGHADFEGNGGDQQQLLSYRAWAGLMGWVPPPISILGWPVRCHPIDDDAHQTRHMPMFDC